MGKYDYEVGRYFGIRITSLSVTVNGTGESEPSVELRPARMPLARQKGQRTNGEPRAVHESVVPEASIEALAKNSRVAPLQFDKRIK